MTDSKYVVTSDFDGTLFDPNLRCLLAWSYNLKTSKLLTEHEIPLILNTGRPIWDYFSDFQIMIVGMKKPDVVIYGAGTNIAWLKENGYVEDEEWQKKMKSTNWSKQKIVKQLPPFLKKYNAKLFESENPFMTRLWVYKTPIEQLQNLIKELEDTFPDTQVLPTEQILLPNTEDVFSGYLLLVPSSAGKDVGMHYVLDKLQKNSQVKFINLVFGDALVDTSMLKDKTSLGYALNPTALARKALIGAPVEICKGSPPENLLRVLKSHIMPPKSTRNSPYRGISNGITYLLERFIEPKKTPDQLSLQGLRYVRKAIAKTGLISTFILLWGMILDVIDGARARRKPGLTTPDGQLIDVYADRMKEYLLLSARGQHDAAVSCFLPSIARAQAEALGVIVPEFDSAGGSALSRSIKLIKSFFYFSIGLKKQSQNVDNKIFASNLQTFNNRKQHVQNFSWSKLKNYDKTSVKRLLFLVDLLQQQVKKETVHEQALKENLEEYMVIKIPMHLKKLKIEFPKI